MPAENVGASRPIDLLVSDEIDMTVGGPTNFGGNWSTALTGKKWIPLRGTVEVTAWNGVTVTGAPTSTFVGEPTGLLGLVISGNAATAALVNTAAGTWTAPFVLPYVAAGSLAPGYGLYDLTTQPKICNNANTPYSGTGLVLKFKWYCWGRII